MMKSLSLICVLGTAEALKIEQCCGASVTTCCPSSVVMTESEHKALFGEALDDMEDNLNDVVSGHNPTLKDGEEVNEKAFDATKIMFNFANTQASEVLDLINKVEPALDYWVNDGELSNYQANMIRDYFYDADKAADDIQDYMVSY